MIYTAFTCGGTALGLFTVAASVSLKEPASCRGWFNQGNVLVDYSIGNGSVGERFMGVLK